MQGWDGKEKEEFTKKLLKKHGEVGEIGFISLSSDFAHAFVVTPGWRLLPEVYFYLFIYFFSLLPNQTEIRRGNERRKWKRGG